MSNQPGEQKSSAHEVSDKELSDVAGGAFNAFINFGDIKGESTDKDHKDWVQLLSFGHNG